MRQIFSLISCLCIFIITAAQKQDISSLAFKTVCMPSVSSYKPLIVIDGVIAEKCDVRKIDPGAIKSIDILKDPGNGSMFCNNPGQGVILITTKAADQRLIKVKDMLTGEGLRGATVELTYKMSDRDTSLMMKTDSLGMLLTDKIVFGKDYHLKVTSVGYKSFISIVSSKIIGRSYEVMLERNYQQLKDVVITPSCTGRRIGCWSPLPRNAIKESAEKIPSPKTSIKIYPNPVARSQEIKFEFVSANEKRLIVKLFGMNGQLINSHEYSATVGRNKIEFPISTGLAAGLYMVRVIVADDKQMFSEKLVVQ